MPRASRLRLALLAVVAAVLVMSCGNDGGPSGATSSGPARSIGEWCALYEQSLPALNPPPTGRELQILNQYVTRYNDLAAGASGVPSSTADLAKRFADAFAKIRSRVANGEDLSSVLADASQQPDGMFQIGEQLDRAVQMSCGRSSASS